MKKMASIFIAIVLMANCTKKDNSESKASDLDIQSKSTLVGTYENFYIGQCQMIVTITERFVDKIILPKSVFASFVAGDLDLESQGNCDESWCTLGSDTTNMDLWIPKTIEATIVNTDFAKESCQNVMSDYGSHDASVSESVAGRFKAAKSVTLLLHQTSKDAEFTTYFGDTFPVVMKLTIDSQNRLVFSGETDVNALTAVNLTGFDGSLCETVKDASNQEILTTAAQTPLTDCRPALSNNSLQFSRDTTTYSNIAVITP